MTRSSGRWILLATALLISAASIHADDPPMAVPNGDAPTPTLQDQAMQTLGGRLFWGDVRHFRGWRIQQNVLTGHYRLLDPADRRFASGTRADCDAALDKLIADRRLPPMTGKAVILLHGMGRSGKCWTKLAQRLETEGYHVLRFDYPSTRSSLTDSAGYLAQVIDGLPEVEEISFVAHSMGGLVTRAYLLAHPEMNAPDGRLKRLVMLGVPNRGAEMADLVGEWPLFQLVCGPGGCQLVTDPAGVIATLPTPEFEFAVVSGARGTPGGYNPLIPGDDDGTVTVASTRLPGAADFLPVEGGMHSFLMFDPRVVEATARFLETGKLREEGDPHPIPAPAAAAKTPVAVPVGPAASAPSG